MPKPVAESADLFSQLKLQLSPGSTQLGSGSDPRLFGEMLHQSQESFAPRDLTDLQKSEKPKVMNKVMNRVMNKDEFSVQPLRTEIQPKQALSQPKTDT